VTIPGSNSRHQPPYKVAGAVALALVVGIVVLLGMQFRGNFSANTELTMVASRAGLVMDPGSKVTYNGVAIGRVGSVSLITDAGSTEAELKLKVDPKYIKLIPANVEARIEATTVFGNKYVAFTSPKNPTARRISGGDIIDVTSVTTEINTLFETVTSIAQQVDPVKLNTTLTAAAQALGGLGNKFGDSLANADHILADLNPQMDQIHTDLTRAADLADIYTNASPDLWAFLNNSVTTARTLNDQRSNVDQALLAAVGLGNTGADVVGRAGPFFSRGQADLVPTSELLDEYSPALFCTIRNWHDVEPKFAAATGGNGYSASTETPIVFPGNPYVYPDNLPRVNAHGGPEGRPGCWQPITRDLWPEPYLVMDTGASIAPYNHLGIGQPALIDYVWGRQIGENTINP
jgi:phospholipid/cholesterol/gamma-HCH transport system substrate-binding protein